MVLTYVTSRGPWYHVSWKGSEERSGGVATNIGIHLFDLLMWLFGPAESSEVHLGAIQDGRSLLSSTRMCGGSCPLTFGTCQRLRERRAGARIDR